MSFQRVVLVTGCTTGGIGFSLCQEFARQGCKVYATSRNVESMKGFSDTNIIRRPLDVTDSESINNVVNEIIETEGKIDVVVNNAGVLGIGPITDLDIDNVRAVYDANVFSILRMTKAVVPHMSKRKEGLIINMGSVGGNVASPWNGLYTSSKAAVHNLTDTLDMELRPFNIKVLLIAAGAVKSNLAKNQGKMFSLPSNSLYTSFLDSIVARLHASQGPESTPTEEFARKVVTQALQTKPPSYLSIGGFSTRLGILRWFPRSFVLWFIWSSILRRRVPSTLKAS